ncbi:galactokinase [Nanchangia anserum]|uniref:Galactokinase n=1 Tax=Nanchangia anserum TaxID=2692125 RepID=A0A8I0GDG5_9ACTO|nr:galactokinase [Nanchangia anserum]MBD3690130.1 galactokinase [Nanchangia anserum]QOX82088.1 galactokinase [Nanchangia anserum]
MGADVYFTEAWTQTEGAQRVRTLFENSYGAQPAGVWQAPGRVNLIGEHTDYNGGVALPIALPHRTYAAMSPREDRTIRLVSAQDDGGIREVSLDEIGPADSAHRVEGWPAYVAGVAWALEQAGVEGIRGFDLAIDSCVPFGSGLSSSAALECAVAVGLDALFELGLAGSAEEPNDEGRKTLVAACIRAENDVAGANTGGLDQAASLRCREGEALFLDCRTGRTEGVPFDLAAEGLALLVTDTRAPHSLADGQYNERRATCEAAAAELGVDVLADVTDRDAAIEKLDDETQVKRVRHVVDEIERTYACIDALRSGPLRGDVLDQVATLFDGSHDSLRDDYEVTCPELDTAVDVARAKGAHGARMTGGGFGGSCIAIVAADQVDEIARAIAEAYAEAGFNAPQFLLASPSLPAGAVSE